jgi:hypothetical protein
VIEEVLGQGKFELADQLYPKDFVNHGMTRDIGLKEDRDAAHGWKAVARFVECEYRRSTA